MNDYHSLIDGPAEPIGLAMNADGYIPDQNGELIELKLPGDLGWAEHIFNLRKRQATTLTKHGWKFVKHEGPRGTYYDAFSPDGTRVMTEQKQCEKAAFIAAIDQAFSRQFPF